MENIEFYKCQDMGIVSYLRLHGQEPQKCEWVSGSCTWTFILSEGLLKLVSAYSSDDAYVHPREMSRAMGATRHDFFEAKRAVEAAGEKV